MARAGEIWQRPVLVVKFPQPISGFFDGMRSGGEFKPDIGYRTEKPRAGYIKWGDFSLNFWFTAMGGKTWKMAAANAMKRLKAVTKVPGATFSTEWIDEDRRR